MGSRSSDQVLAPHEWRAKLGRKKTGPLSEITVRKLLAEKSLKDDVWFQKGNSPYRSAEEVRDLFRRLDRDGLYLKNNDIVEGPYTPAMLFKRLNEVGPGAADWLGWRGSDGTWLGVKEILKAFDDPHSDNTIAARELLLDKEMDSGISDSVVESSIDSMNESSMFSFGPSSLEILELGDDGIDSVSDSGPGVASVVQDYLRPETRSIQTESDRKPESKAVDYFASVLDAAAAVRESHHGGESDFFTLHTGLDDQAPKNLSTNATKSVSASSEENIPTVAEQPRRRKIRTGGRRGTLCLDCGKQVNPKTYVCDHCRAEIELENTEAVREKQAVRSKRRPINVSKNDGDSFQLHQLARLVALSAAFATSGVFLSKWMIGSVLWRTMHSGQQQAFGWFAFFIAAVLSGSALFAIKKEFSTRQHGKLIKLGGVSLLVASAISYFVLTDRFRTMESDLSAEMVMWTKMMESGGYQQVMLEGDQEQPLNSTFEGDDGASNPQRELSETELEFRRRMESYRTGAISAD